MTESSEQRTCPECGHLLDSADQLCVECGFHLGLGKRFRRATVELTDLQLGDLDFSESSGRGLPQRESENPFSVPLSRPERASECIQQGDAERVRAVVDGALPFYMTAVLAVCVCFPVLPFLAPLYAVRLIRWWSMRQRFENLRNPNSLSPFVDLELRFQSAGWQYCFSISVGILQIAFVIFAILSRN
ncbi:MAG TPA: hypothetical protein DDW52_18610 [Planctomycetaceae bacterium]|nr:hypothetical protein [Planctomycetaceae bacterium]